ncbi:MAG: amino-acid N-acetyltransferase [Thiotrichales bacterium]|nr:amino-acid N-acetyltransferase [Thiotrichales bacterium]
MIDAIPTGDATQFVEWFRRAAPYINAHRGRTFVVEIGGESVDDPQLPGIVHDLALMRSLGVNLVVVHGAQPWIEQGVRARGLASRCVDGVRITDIATLETAREAIGAAHVQIEALLSMGIANSPMAGARVRVASGNFVTARPIGIRDGVDYEHTGEVRRIDAEAIRQRLADGAIVLVSPLGYSPTGEIFSLRAEEVATAIATGIGAGKLVFLLGGPGIVDDRGTLIRELTPDEATALAADLSQETDAGDMIGGRLRQSIRACRGGVNRVHIIDQGIEGALLLELFSRDGVGTMINADAYDSIRRATIDDIGGILELIRPLEESGALVRRSREKLETEIAHFSVVDRDSAVVACAAMYPYPGDRLAELACLAVDDAYRGSQYGERLLTLAEREAREAGAQQLFVLTTQAAHWFRERGFVEADHSMLPDERQALYNFQRRSRVLVRAL